MFDEDTRDFGGGFDFRAKAHRIDTQVYIRLGTRQHFELMVIIRDSTVNDNVVTTGRTISRVLVLFIVRL